MRVEPRRPGAGRGEHVASAPGRRVEVFSKAGRPDADVPALVAAMRADDPERPGRAVLDELEVPLDDEPAAVRGDVEALLGH